MGVILVQMKVPSPEEDRVEKHLGGRILETGRLNGFLNGCGVTDDDYSKLLDGAGVSVGYKCFVALGVTARCFTNEPENVKSEDLVNENIST